jgi:hypothetical protein
MDGPILNENRRCPEDNRLDLLFSLRSESAVEHTLCPSALSDTTEGAGDGSTLGADGSNGVEFELRDDVRGSIFFSPSGCTCFEMYPKDRTDSQLDCVRVNSSAEAREMERVRTSFILDTPLLKRDRGRLRTRLSQPAPAMVPLLPRNANRRPGERRPDKPVSDTSVHDLTWRNCSSAI